MSKLSDDSLSKWLEERFNKITKEFEARYSPEVRQSKTFKTSTYHVPGRFVPKPKPEIDPWTEEPTLTHDPDLPIENMEEQEKLGT